MHLTQADIVASVFNAGIIGAGGGGFPTHVKLQAKVDTVLANGSECEPLLQSDKTLLRKHADDVVRGVKLVMQATGATQGMIAIKGHYTDVVESVASVLTSESNIKIHKLKNYYPAGDEFLTVYDTTGRIIPEGGLPLNVGVVVCNVLTLKQIAEAVSGKPVTERMMTVAGEVGLPCVLTVPIGTPYKSILHTAGNITSDDAVVIDGGPMMGRVVDDLETGIAKTTSGILVLPRESLVVRMKTKTLSQMVKLSKAACCQCFRCTDLCPRSLLGHDIFPHKTMRTIDYNLSEPSRDITSAFLCSQCGVCELVACDFMQLSPRQIYAAYKKELVSQGIKNPHHKTPLKVDSAYEDRKVSVEMLIKKLGLTKYKCETPDLGFKEAAFVSIAFDRHVGVKSIPTVSVGQKIRKGDLIAACPAQSLGANYHASISGEVVAVNDRNIQLKARP